ncbi:unnamed protein product [Medioppia subpectinata]|uniref:GH18 domain-containing protein n=1 Tax=Medioppia subpectinata TaxID=1979941 RepID=A0A7R9KJR5_9ACAR|nr:unnamed protein product [Medioppia subpectinata]CAG2103647.1 unnamed protein product [Medioppia subpectinata]
MINHNDYVRNPHPIVCYFGSWAWYHEAERFDIDDVNYELCTHINYGFAKIDEYNYTIQMFDPYLDYTHFQAYQRFIDLKKKNPNLTTMISLGGWNEGSEKYSDMVTNTDIRRRFVRSVVDFLNEHNFDGLDLDWEHPGSRGGAETDKQNYVKLLEELREAFEPKGYLLTAAISASKETINGAFVVPKLNELLDWANIMTYDYHGGFDNYIGHNAPLYRRPDETPELEKQLHTDYTHFTVDYSINYYLSLGLSKDKMVMGVPFYGRGWTLLDAQHNHIHDEAKGMSPAGWIGGEPGVLGYNELCQMFKKNASDWQHSNDSHYLAPYSWTKDTFIGHEDKESLQCKIAYLKAKGLKGAMVWALENDDFKGRCGDGKYPLLQTVYSMLNGDDKHSMQCPYGEVIPTTAPPTTTPKPTSPTTKPTDPPTTSPTPTPTPTPTPDPVDPMCTRDGYMPDLSNPHKFYQCESIGPHKWRLTLRSCYGDLVWHQELKRCDN